MKRKPKLHDVVRLKRIKGGKLFGPIKCGSVGTIVHIYIGGGLCEVEFDELPGNTMTCLTAMLELV